MTYLSANNVKNQVAVKYIVSDENIQTITDEFTSSIKWKHFTNIKETKNYFFLSLKNGQKMILPKRDFSNFEQLQEFKDLLETKIGNEAILIKKNIWIYNDWKIHFARNGRDLDAEK